MRCICGAFSDFSALEWVIKFHNTGQYETPIIEDIRALNTVLNRKGNEEFILHRLLGSNCIINDFAPIDEMIELNSFNDL